MLFLILIAQPLQLNADYSDALATKTKNTFVSAFTNDVAQATGVSISRITLTTVSAGRSSNMRASASAFRPWLLSYYVTRYDLTVPTEVFTAQLTTRVASEEFATTFRNYAVLFNATELTNVTLGTPLFTGFLPSETTKDPVNAGETAGVVIGGFLFLVMLSVGVWFIVKWIRSFKVVKDGYGESEEEQNGHGEGSKKDEVSPTAVPGSHQWLTVSEMMQTV